MPTIQDVRVFVSSTRKDLSPADDPLLNCRECAIQAVAVGAALPVTMETWVTPYAKPEDVCKGKVLKSSHYLGIFAYRRGWEPDSLAPKSITEAEFEWASGSKKEADIAVLI